MIHRFAWFFLWVYVGGAGSVSVQADEPGAAEMKIITALQDRASVGVQESEFDAAWMRSFGWLVDTLARSGREQALKDALDDGRQRMDQWGVRLAMAAALKRTYSVRSCRPMVIAYLNSLTDQADGQKVILDVVGSHARSDWSEAFKIASSLAADEPLHRSLDLVLIRDMPAGLAPDAAKACVERLWASRTALDDRGAVVLTKALVGIGETARARKLLESLGHPDVEGSIEKLRFANGLISAQAASEVNPDRFSGLLWVQAMHSQIVRVDADGVKAFERLAERAWVASMSYEDLEERVGAAILWLTVAEESGFRRTLTTRMIAVSDMIERVEVDDDREYWQGFFYGRCVSSPVMAGIIVEYVNRIDERGQKDDVALKGATTMIDAGNRLVASKYMTMLKGEDAQSMAEFRWKRKFGIPVNAEYVRAAIGKLEDWGFTVTTYDAVYELGRLAGANQLSPKLVDQFETLEARPMFAIGMADGLLDANRDVTDQLGAGGVQAPGSGNKKGGKNQRAH